MTSPRQLTYTSVDALDGSLGGWQVKDRSPELTEPEAQAVLALAATRLDFVEPPPRFPSAAEIAALPARLVTAQELGRSLLVHSAAAGNDASGRPGNVFTHALVIDDQPGAPRPLEWWRSPGWLRPYGADAVRECTLGAPPGPGGVVSAASVSGFLGRCNPHGLGALVDAVGRCFGTDHRVVLVEDDPDTAALWLACVSFMLPPFGHAWLSMSTFERSFSLTPMTVAVISASDVGDLPRDPALLAVQPGTQQPPGTGWDLLRGAVEVSTWSRLAQALAQTPDRSDRLQRLDRLALANPGAAGRYLVWALAAALLDVEPDIAVPVLTGALVYTDEPELRDAVREALALRAGQTPSEIGEHLAGLRTDGGPWNDEQLAVFEHWLSRAVYDDEALLGDWPPLLPDLALADDAYRAGLAGTVADAVEELAEEELDTATHSALTLRLLDLAHRLGVADLLGPDAGKPNELALFLPGQHGPTIVGQARDLDPATVAAVDERLPDALRAGLAPEVEAWLAGARPAVPEQTEVPTAPVDGGAAPPPLPPIASTPPPPLVVGEASPQARDYDPAQAERVLMQLSLGSPDAVDVAIGIGRDPSLPVALQNLCLVHRTFEQDWWQRGPERALDEAEAVLAGLQLLTPDRAGAFSTELSGHLLAAVVRGEAWWESPDPVPFDVARRLRNSEIALLELVQPLHGVTEPTVSMLLAHDGLASIVAKAACKMGPVRVAGFVLRDILSLEEQSDFHVKSVARALLREAALRTDDPETWIRNRSPLGEGAPPEHDLLTLVNLTGAPIT